jgi:hypothetical protein
MGKKARAQNRSRGRSVVELYNGQRPHTSLNGLTPIEFANRSRIDQNRNRLSL